MTVDTDQMAVLKDGQPLQLSQREYDLIRFLAAQPGKVFSREALMEHVWDYEGYVGDVRAVDVAVRRLREKIEDDPASPKFVVTKRGWGTTSAAEPEGRGQGRPRGPAAGGRRWSGADPERERRVLSGRSIRPGDQKKERAPAGRVLRKLTPPVLNS